MTDPTGTDIERELLDEPHVADRRVPVRQLQTAVEERGAAPRAVAIRHDLDPATVYRALAYVHDNPAEMAAVRERRESAFEQFREERTATGPTGSD
jgi:uncharacterized protein (DUF433 family)